MTHSRLLSVVSLAVVLACFGWTPVAIAQEQGERDDAGVREYVSRTVSIIVDESIEDLEEKVEQAVHDPNCMLNAFGPESEDNWWPGIHIEPLEAAGPHARLIRIIVPLRFHDDDEDDDFDEDRDEDEDETMSVDPAVE